MTGARTLDFIVIGAQKAGTTSLWRHLCAHPRICMPRSKEAPFFAAGSEGSSQLDSFIEKHFPEAVSGALFGKATPNYMIGWPDASVEIVAERIAETLPEVKLIASLRDPIERAISHFCMSVRRGWENRDPDAAFKELLAAEELRNARLQPTPVNSYIVRGEYGRILDVYYRFFASTRLLLVYTADMAEEPGEVLDAVLTFLGLPGGFRPEGLGIRYFRGGPRKLLDAVAEKSLLEYFDREVLPHLRGDRDVHMNAFKFFFDTWNVAPDHMLHELSPQVRLRLEEHFRKDAGQLEELGVRVPWIAKWSNGAGPTSSSNTSER